MHRDYQVPLKINISSSYLSGILASLMDHYLEEWDLEVNGVEVHLQKKGNLEARIIKNVIWLSVPLDVHLKRPSGLFTVEAGGSVVMHLQTPFAFDHNLRLLTEMKLTHYDWIEKPTFQMGVLQIPLTTLIKLIISHASSIITGKMDSVLKEKVNVRELMDAWIYKPFSQLNIFVEHSLYPDLKIKRIDIVNAMTPGDDLEWNVLVSYQLVISDKKVTESEYPLIFVHEDTKVSQPIFPAGATLFLSEFILAQQLKKESKNMQLGSKILSLESIQWQVGEDIRLTTSVKEPVPMTIDLQFEVVNNHDHSELRWDENALTVRPHKWIYRLIGPVVKKLIKNKMAEWTSGNIQAYIDNIKSEFPQTISYNELKVNLHPLNPQIERIRPHKGYLEMNMICKSLEIIVVETENK
ncbi:MAG TPA: DUF4403 family protein [Saprospiraceae bacterium]|nr:DUF4403 family protein [Saprospiraceae bacterium]